MGNVHSIRSDGADNSDQVDLEIDDTQNVRQLTEASPGQPTILVLSRDADLIETVRKAAPRGTPVSQAPDLDHAADSLPSLRPGVLVADTACTTDVAAMVAQLTQHFPELVVVVAGKREDSASLMQLTAAGRIFRFLLKPLSHGQTKLTLEAAVAQHVDLVNAAQRKGIGVSSGGESKSYLKGYLMLGGALVVVIGGIWFAVSRFTSDEAPVTPAASGTQLPVSTLGEKPDPVKAELALAREAFAAGRYLEPAGESALDLYRSALALNPESQEAREGIRAVADKVLERAEAALLAEKLEEAVKNIETARDIDPKHPRLAFFDTQIARERERLKLTQAQEIGSRVRQLLAIANTRVQQGALISPTGESARDALVEARRLDPTDPAVLQAIRDLGQSISEEARKAISSGRLDEAQRLVTAARQLGTVGAALASVERQLADARVPQQAATPAAPTPAVPSANEVLVTNIRQRISAGKLIDPKGDSARDLLMQLRAAEPANPAIEELSRALSTRLLDSGKQAMAAKAYERSQALLAASREIGAQYNEAALKEAEAQLSKALAEQAFARNIVSAGTLKRKRTVPPEYPAEARRQKIEGWVEVVFTVMPDGTVDEVEVRNASPANVFDEAAVRAVKQWRFEPVSRDGEKVPQRAITRLRFKDE